IVHYHISGTDRIKGIRNIGVGADHFSVVNSLTVTRGLAAEAANACLQNLPPNMDVGDSTSPVRDWTPGNSGVSWDM
ncbi:MAG: hypothetical protein KAR11_08780, partial [Phycisphaerae bacterium]|nr:hypothetical protein [Phycisphaerae bacterium]